MVNTAGGVLANDRGPGGSSDLEARVVAATRPDPESEGELVLAADGSFVFIPASGFSGRIEVHYEASAPGGASAIGRLTIEVAKNQAPRAGDEAVATDEDTPVLIAVLANDVDPEGHALRVTAVGAPFYGTVELRADMTVIYRPWPDFVGIDAFDYEVCDAFDACAGATVAVTVRPVNDAPWAADDFVTSDGDTVVSIDVLANDGDPDGDPLHIGALDVDAGDGHEGLIGRVEIVDGVVVFTPAVGFEGTTGFGYLACDGHGACDGARVTIQVGAGAVEPVIEVVDDFIETRAGTAATINVLDNDRALAGGDLTLGAWGRPRAGTVTAAPDGTVTYLPARGFVGDDAFSYTACVGNRCALAMVWVTVVEGDNHAPVAIDDLVTTTVDTPVVFDPRDNDLDVDGDAISVVAVGAPSFGQATLADDGSVTYLPAPGFVGQDAFWIEIDDGRGGTDRSTVTVIVLPIDNRAPVAVDDTFEVAMTPLDAEPVAHVLDVLANDSDPDGDPLVIDVVMQPENGLATIDGAGGGIAYAPRGGFVGLDYVLYRVSDGRGGFDVATVTIVVGAVDDNHVPEVVDDEVVTPEDEAVTIDVLANDSDPDGDPLIVELAAGPAQGSVNLLEDGRFTYTPRADFFGDDGFSYTACDEGGACATADVLIEVTPVNDRPVARDDRGTMLATVGGTFDVLANDSDVDGDVLVVGVIGVPDVGAVAREVDGRLAVTAPAAFSGLLTFTYQACDPDGLCDEALVEIEVAGQATGPNAVDDTATTQANVAVTIDVLANDSDPQGDTLTIQSLNFPTVGGARIVDGAVLYTPAEDWVGIDAFQYVVCDLGGLCAQARVVVTVTLPMGNRAPIARDDVFELTTSAPQRIDVLANDEDPDGDRLRVVSVTPATQGEVSIGSDQKIVYTPVATLIGGETLTYTVCDPWDACDEATLSIVREAPELTKFELAGGPNCQSGGGATLLMLGLALVVLGWRRRRACRSIGGDR